MAVQKTLFGEKNNKKEKQTKEETYEEKAEIIGEEIKEDKYGWKQFNEKMKKEEGIDYVSLQLVSKTDLGGIKKAVVYTANSEMPNGMLGSSYCGGGIAFDINKTEDIKNYFKEHMERKKRALKKVYRKFTKEETEIKHEHHLAYYYFRLIPAKNYFFVISDKLLELLKEKGFDFDKWYKKYRALPENPATAEHWKKVQELLQLYKKGEKIVTRIKQLKKIEEGEEKIQDLSLFQLKDEDRKKQLEELPEKLKKISEDIQEIEKFCGAVYYSKPFEWELKEYKEMKKK